MFLGRGGERKENRRGKRVQIGGLLPSNEDGWTLLPVEKCSAVSYI